MTKISFSQVFVAAELPTQIRMAMVPLIVMMAVPMIP
jgi:hypothetical protein